MLTEADYESVKLTLNHGDRLFFIKTMYICVNELKESFGDNRLQGLLKMENNLPLHRVFKIFKTASEIIRNISD